MNSALRKRGRRLVGILAPLAALALVAAFAPAAVAADKPIAWTQPATLVAAGGAQLNAYVGASELETAYQFEYGTDTSYGSSVPAEARSIGTSFFEEVSEQVTGLEPGTTYHYRVVATNAEGTSYGEDHTFTTESYEVLDNASGAPCEPVTVEGPIVSGGCPAIELDSLVGWVSINGWQSCNLHLGEMRVDGGGGLYVYDTVLANANGGSCGVVTCPNASGEQVSWAGAIRAIGQDQYVVDLEICLETVFGPLGTETITTSLEGFDGGQLTLSQEGHSEEGNLLHGGVWGGGFHDFTIEDLE